jgi:hypothetical protein
MNLSEFHGRLIVADDGAGFRVYLKAPADLVECCSGIIGRTCRP